MATTAATPTLDRDRIALRAYYLWEAEGRPDGRHAAHWLAAEATEKRSLAARRAAATRRAKQAAAPKAAPKADVATVVAAAAVATSRGAGARATRHLH